MTSTFERLPARAGRSPKSLGRALLGFLAVCAALGAGGCTAKDDSPQPSIFLITVDALRPDHVGAYGYERPTTPNIDGVAAEAILFERAFAHAPETRFSFGSIFSGYYPHETRVIGDHRLSENVETMAEILQARGYRTVAVVSNYMLRAGLGYEQGFAVYDDEMEEAEAVRKLPERTAARTTDRAVKHLDASRERPLFMWVHYQDPHGPYTPPEEYAALFEDPARPPRPLPANSALHGLGGIPSYQVLGDKRDFGDYISRYDGEIRYMDEHLGRFFQSLRERALYDRSLIILTADHGEGMGEHDYFFAHGDSLYREMLHVPLILRYGGERGRRRDLAQHIDLVPTILDALGLKAAPGYRGRSLLAGPQQERVLFAQMNSAFVKDGLKFTVFNDSLKLIYTPSTGRYELYDLAADPGEKRNIFYERRGEPQAESLRSELARLWREDRLKLGAAPPRAPVSKEEMEKMRSLGYIR